MKLKPTTYTIKMLEADLISIKELLITLINDPSSLKKYFQKKSFEKLTAIHDEFISLFNNVFRYKYKISICGLNVKEKWLHQGLMQNETKKLSTFLNVVSNTHYSPALLFLQSKIHILKKAHFSLKNINIFMGALNKILSKNDFEFQQRETSCESFFADLDCIDFFLKHTGEFFPLLSIQDLVKVCDHLLSFNNTKAVNALNNFYQRLYSVVNEIPDPIIKLKILVGYSLYTDIINPKNSMSKKIAQLFLENARRNDLFESLNSMLNKFINSNHSSLITQEYSINQSLCIWKCFKDIVSAQDEKSEMYHKITVMIAKIIKGEELELTDEESTSPISSDFTGNNSAVTSLKCFENSKHFIFLNGKEIINHVTSPSKDCLTSSNSKPTQL